MLVQIDLEWLKDLATHEPGARQTGYEAHRELRGMARQMLAACVDRRLVRAICDGCGCIQYGEAAEDNAWICGDDRLRCTPCMHRYESAMKPMQCAR